VASGVYVVLGDTGRGSEGRPNAGFIVTGDGVVVIDALGSPAQGEQLVRSIRSVTREPIRWLVLTHHHPDHHFGAVVLRRAGARVIAHPDVSTGVDEQSREAAESAWTLVVGKEQMTGFAYADMPDRAVATADTLRLGGKTIVIARPWRGRGAGGAHTAGDLIVWLPAERVLFAGDLLIEDGVTMVVDGSGKGLLAVLDTLAALAPRVAVPGHGAIPAEPQALIGRTRDYMVRLRAECAEPSSGTARSTARSTRSRRPTRGVRCHSTRASAVTRIGYISRSRRKSWDWSPDHAARVADPARAVAATDLHRRAG
jgi:glyoxylase-like metal-dependent hydrolase (beta-lactamase superfamily II)